jgi:hypothetical protein
MGVTNGRKHVEVQVRFAGLQVHPAVWNAAEIAKVRAVDCDSTSGARLDGRVPARQLLPAGSLPPDEHERSPPSEDQAGDDDERCVRADGDAESG